MVHKKENYSELSREVIHSAFRFAGSRRMGFVTGADILWSLSRKAEHSAFKALRSVGLDNSIIHQVIEQYEKKGEAFALQVQGLAADAEAAFGLAESHMVRLGHSMVEPEHILLGLLQDNLSEVSKLVASTGVEPSGLSKALVGMMVNGSWPRVKAKTAEKKPGKEDTTTLGKYSKDLTMLAAQDKLDPVIGREEEICRVVQILSRRTKNNPVLIGEPGVGKTAIAEGLARRIINGRVPENLAGKRLLMLDLARMVSGAKFRGDFEERIKGCIEEAISSGDVVLFVDEMHTLIGAGAAEGAMDAANILKPALSRGQLQVIGATTLSEYRKHIEKDSALERRFQSIIVGEPTQEDALEILKGLRERYEAHHKLTITDQALKAAVKMGARYIQDRFLPDKAIDLVDEAASRVRTGSLAAPPQFKELEDKIAELAAKKDAAVKNQLYEQAAPLRDQQKELRETLERKRAEYLASKAGRVEAEDIARVVSAWTGIPVTMITQDESERLLNLESVLHERVVGQDSAVSAVSKAIRRGRAGLKDPSRPMGTFLFLGPTGVGKTELTKAVAAAVFQDESSMIRLDMSEFMERHTVSKIIGSPPGYVGYDDGGQLTEKVRRSPYSVILFDEIEKAHPDVFGILLQIMEDGRLTDSHGRTVDFRNTIVIMTSNIGARNITDGKRALGFSAAASEGDGVKSSEQIREKVMGDLKDAFKPEFLNRIDDMVVFHQLSGEHIREIAGVMLVSLQDRLAEMEIELEVDDDAMEIICQKGFDPKFGARPLRRAIQSLIEDKAASALLDGEFASGDKMLVGARDGEVIITKAKTLSALTV